MRLMILAAALCAALAIVPETASAQRGGGGPPLAGTWFQTYSSAGRCPTCRISVQATQGGYVVRSSNGWSARLRGDAYRASGRGVRRSNDAFGGPFDVSIATDGANLQLNMRAEMTGATLRATFSR